MESTRPSAEIVSHHILATANFADARARVLKDGDTFAIFDHDGGIKSGRLGEQGIYHEGTRLLSGLRMDLEGRPLMFLGSTAGGDSGQLAMVLTNPDLVEDDRVRLPFGTLHFGLRTFLLRGVCYQQLRVKNHSTSRVDTWLSIAFAADFIDIFEVSGQKRTQRGTTLAADICSNQVRLRYLGLDGVLRQLTVQFTPLPAELSPSAAKLDLLLEPQQEAELLLTFACKGGLFDSQSLPFEQARNVMQAKVASYSSWSCHIQTSSGQTNAWIDRAVSDLRMMTTDLPTGPYPYAGLPWFNTPFGRDGIITALECLWLRPNLARGVLGYLASTQATAVIPAQDAEPGKILHETRQGEMAALGELPFSQYYGSADATPLFVLLAGAYYERTGDVAFAKSIWSHVEAALNWIDNYGDCDGDGFVEYRRASATGLVHQGWKDSDDAIFHSDGTPADGPIALSEVQAYVFAARRAAATLAKALGCAERAAQLNEAASALQQRFEDTFWSEKIGTYALALDGDKQPCLLRTSNAGHCLFAGIANPARALQVARSLLAEDAYSGWGIRTLATSEIRYNPMGYHNGSIWPHDNAIIARGLARYGLAEGAVQILNNLLEAGMHFDSDRMPELFCGFPRDPGEGPVFYPVACSPQAWAAGSVFLLLQAALGLEISAIEKQVSFTRPQLPRSLDELRVYNLEIAGATVDLLLVRRDHDVGVNVLRRDGNVQVIVVK